MKNSLVKLTQASLASVLVFLFLAVAAGQTGSCDQRLGGVFSTRFGSIDDFVNDFCNSTPTDVVLNSATCRNCFPGAPRDPYPQFSKGGTAGCTGYDKQMVIEFAQPVADLEVEIWGARTVTDNRGYTMHMNPPLDSGGAPTQAVIAKFPGSGITRHRRSLAYESVRKEVLKQMNRR